MTKIVPFKAIRPTRDKAYLVSSKPAYTYKKNLLDAKLESNPYTFLHVINPEFRSDNKTKPNTVERFQHVKDKFDEFHQKGIFIQDQTDCLYLYRQITPINTHIGIIAGAAIDDYTSGHIKIHEHTLTKREKTFQKYLEVCQFNAEPVLLTYPDNDDINTIINKYLPTRSEYEFNTTAEIKHDLWVIKDQKDIDHLTEYFSHIKNVYIADGHHRTASSVLYGKGKREQDKSYKEDAKFNYFLAYFIAESNLNIMEYNRIISSLNGLSLDEFLQKVKEKFIVEEKKKSFSPTQLHHFSMYIEGKWYLLVAKSSIINDDEIVEHLDTQILFKNIINPILGIQDSKTDSRISFINGTLGTKGLQKSVDSGKAKVAFGLHPISVGDIKAIADSNNIMPPKSTYIDPKLRSGLTIYDLNG